MILACAEGLSHANRGFTALPKITTLQGDRINRIVPGRQPGGFE